MDPSVTWEDYKLTRILECIQSLPVTPALKTLHLHRAIWLGNVNTDVITWREIHEYLQLHPESNLLETDGFGLKMSSNPHVTWLDVQRYPQVLWHYYVLSSHPNITWEVIQQHPDLWNPQASCNPNVTWEIIQQHPEFPWSGYYLSRNPNLTWEMIHQLTPNPSYVQMSYNPNITWDIIRAHPEKPWSMQTLAAHSPHITWEHHIVKYPFLFLDCQCAFLVSNPNTRFDLIIEHLSYPGFKETLLGLLLRTDFVEEKKQYWASRRSLYPLFSEMFQWYFHPSRWDIIQQHGHFS